MEEHPIFPLTRPQRQIYDSETYYGGAVGQLCVCLILRDTMEEAALSGVIDALRGCNDALRLHLVETPDGPAQMAAPYAPLPAEPPLYFSDRAALEEYAAAWAKEPMDRYSALCRLRAVLLPGRFGILVKLDHMAADEWSCVLLCNQIRALLRGEKPQGRSYRSFAGEEEAYFRGERPEKDRRYVLEAFRGREEPLLLASRPDSAPACARETFFLDTSEAARIRSCAAAWNVTPYTLFLTAFAAEISLTHRNAERFYLGTDVHNRANAAEKATVGMFATTVALPVLLCPEASFRENAEGMRRAVTEMLRHRRFNDILTRQELRREYGFEGKLFDAVLSYQSAAVQAEGAELETLWVSGGVQAETLNLRISDREKRGSFRLDYDYRTDDFTADAIHRLHRRLSRLLSDGLDREGTVRLRDMELLTETERRMLRRFNDTAVAVPDCCVHTLFERQAERRPEAPALTDRHGTLCYGELNALSNRVAHALMRRGASPGTFVAFSLPRDRRLAAVMLGILKSGAAYIPIGLHEPRKRVLHMLRESGAKYHVTAENIGELFSCTDTGNPALPVVSEQPCYAIYTSGSAGKPKGAMMSHRGIVNLMDANRFNPIPLRMARGDIARVISVTAATFDLFAMETLLPLTLGLETLLADEEQSCSQTALEQLFSAAPAQAMLLTPTKLKSLLVSPERRGFLRALKLLVLAGEALEADLAEMLAHLTEADIYNAYGPSEVMECTSGLVTAGQDVTIGAPLANTQIHILDRFLHPVPVGVAGEICIAGAVVGPGYLKAPELTAERFLPNPFGGGRLYRSGDLGRWRSDGRIDFLGRSDYQMKLRGVRVEPGEIEAAMRAVPGVADAAAAVYRDTAGRQLLCAYYTGALLSPTYLRRALGRSLPPVMIPQQYVHMDAFPLTATGKLSRRSLPAPDRSVPAQTPYTPPESPLEAELCAAMERILGHGPVGRDHDFFDLGGDSLLILELFAALEQSGYRLPLRTLLENTTPRALAEALQRDITNQDIAFL